MKMAVHTCRRQESTMKSDPIGLTFNSRIFPRADSRLMEFLNEITRSTVVRRKTGTLHGYRFRPAITLYFIMSFATDVTASCSL